MGVVIHDLVRDEPNELCNWWNWRPTVVLMERSGVIDADRLERMQFNGGGAEVSAEEARRIADFISANVLPRMGEGDEVKLTGEISSEPSWKGRITEAPSDEALYGATRGWLEAFVRLCRECDGFGVS